MHDYYSNSWKVIKTNKLQRRDEINSGVNVTKVEKIICMRARLNPLLFFYVRSAAKLRTGESSTTNAASHGSSDAS